MSYEGIKQVLLDNNNQQNEVLRNEIQRLLDFQDFTIKSVERSLDSRLELASWEFTELHFSTSDSIETANLSRILEDLNIDPENEFINIIRKDGLIVNTSSEKYLGQNVFKNDVKFKKFVQEVFRLDKFLAVDFELDSKEKKLVKWSYEATHDNDYIIQIGVNSEEGSDISDAIRGLISKIGEDRASLVSIDIFINPVDPFSFASNAELNTEEKELIKSIFKLKIGKVVNSDVDNHLLDIEYVYSERKSSNLYESLVVRLVKDKTLENELLRDNLYGKAGLFALGMVLLFIVLFVNTNLISRPIKMVSNAADSIGGGDLKKRVPVVGNIELRILAESFNQMAVDLQLSDQKIREQKEKIELAHKEIKDSINYAKRIQSAILPPDRLVKELLGNSFIIYKPKDIIAGDFYWMEKKEETVFFAAADCTGHGVPGAMISVICHSALNRSVREYGLSMPGEILDKAREIVLKEFEKSDVEMMDGMDIALCALQGSTLLFAGAQRPLLIIRNNEVIEYKGNRQPIGLGWKMEPFQSHTIELQKGDSIYLFTDGVTDQFGGENAKKFLISRFKKLLLSIQSESIEKQKKLINESFENWRGKEKQIDDVCVIGIQV